MAEEEVVPGSEAAADEADDAELEASEIVTDDKGNKTVSLSTMLRYKKEAKANAKRIKELEPVAARVTDLEGKLESASPIINAILTNPKLKAEALRVASGKGTRPSGESTDQPEQDDEAREHAEDYGMYLADGVTPDAARARRALNRIAGMTGRQTAEQLRPLAGVTLTREATQNLQLAMAQTDADGVPLATPESIKEVAQRLGTDGQHLLANPQVVEMIIDQAAGIDRRKGRTPKAQDEPLYLAPAGGRRRSEPSVSAEERETAKRLGLDPKYLENAATKLATGKSMRAGKE
jgi:hypothetical protein